uniref:non-specific serine/threonine protein kinase n=1 Tax=Kalanchoe fedtschenkoi TaxID=63787 RepID=A0A7N0RDX8_KALFE
MEDKTQSSNLMGHHRRGSESCSSFSRLSLETPACSEDVVLKPHRLSDTAFSTVRRHQALNFRDFRLLHRIGAGDIGKVYLCKLRADGDQSQSCSYAMKVVDKEVLAAKKKTHRAEMETKILKMLDHPFLPSLYASFEASHFSCIVMEYCSGGDLHSLRHKQPQKRFSLHSARFYAAEVLVALEYLHMLGIIYRDLKPENVLVRSDGHIMLSDFDLSLIADSVAAVEFPEPSPTAAPHPPRAPPPFSCLPIRRPFRSRKVQTITNHQMFVAEPVGARSCSFVGTHEYVAPEVASGKSHGNAVDWWAFGIFLYEMIYGRTPFAGANNIATLRNIVAKPLKFPNAAGLAPGEAEVQDLITCLLAKEPGSRLGSSKGAAEVKTHPFFRGMNFALIRSSTPPPASGKQQLTTTPFKIRKTPTNPRAFDCF